MTKLEEKGMKLFQSVYPETRWFHFDTMALQFDVLMLIGAVI